MSTISPTDTDADADRSQDDQYAPRSVSPTAEDVAADDPTQDTRTRTSLGALAVLASVVAFSRLLGLAGLLAGIAVAVCWYWLSTEATFAFGTLLLVVAVPETPSLRGVALVEGGLVAVLVSTVFQYDAPVRLLSAFITALAGLLAVTWLAIAEANAIWIGTLALVVTITLFAYGQHRYVLVRTGLVEPEEEETK